MNELKQIGESSVNDIIAGVDAQKNNPKKNPKMNNLCPEHNSNRKFMVSRQKSRVQKIIDEFLDNARRRGLFHEKKQHHSTGPSFSSTQPSSSQPFSGPNLNSSLIFNSQQVKKPSLDYSFSSGIRMLHDDQHNDLSFSTPPMRLRENGSLSRHDIDEEFHLNRHFSSDKIQDTPSSPNWLFSQRDFEKRCPSPNANICFSKQITGNMLEEKSVHSNHHHSNSSGSSRHCECCSLKQGTAREGIIPPIAFSLLNSSKNDDKNKVDHTPSRDLFPSHSTQFGQGRIDCNRNNKRRFQYEFPSLDRETRPNIFIDCTQNHSFAMTQPEDHSNDFLIPRSQPMFQRSVATNTLVNASTQTEGRCQCRIQPTATYDYQRPGEKRYGSRLLTSALATSTPKAFGGQVPVKSRRLVFEPNPSSIWSPKSGSSVGKISRYNSVDFEE